LIAGHEFIGKVTAIGDQVVNIKLGQRVGVSPICRSCGDCAQCISSHSQLCPDKVPTYNGKYKGFSTFGVSICTSIDNTLFVSYIIHLGLC
jgi:D-arabinose 1-dehydrogenase-like Zn-dependent alcohol dehydrogenase